MLNMLIAVMTAGYEEVSEGAQPELLRQRAKLLVAQELCMYRIEREYHQQARNSFPRWLHILRKETKMQKRTRWNFSRNRSETDQLSSKLSGKLSLENPAQLAADGLHMLLDEQLNKLHKQQDEFETRVENRLGAIEALLAPLKPQPQPEPEPEPEPSE